MNNTMRIVCKNFLLIACLLAAGVFPGAAAQAGSPQWLRYPAVSPDGRSIAFAAGGQLWLVDARGGEAVPLTSSDFYSTRPVWSPDGKTLAFACKRNGNFDVFVSNLTGDAPRRLTYHSADDLPYAFSADGSAVYFGSSRLGGPETELVGAYHRSQQLYAIPTAGGTARLMLPTPAHEAAVSPDGTTLIYDNCPVYENEWRKGAVSDGARDLWLYEPATGKHRQLTRNRGEDRNGVFGPDGKSVYYTSEQNGSSFNVWQVGLEPGAEPRQITRHQGRPVRFVSLAKDGTLVYAQDGAIWRQPAGEGEARPLEIRMRQSPLVSGAFAASANGYVSEIVARPDGAEAAFVSRGEIFVVSTGNGLTRRITNTPAFEQHLRYSPDGRRLLFCSERDGVSEIFEAALPEGRASFTAPGGLEEKKLVASEVDLLFPAYSPDGNRIAYIDNRNSLKVWDRANNITTTPLPPGRVYSYADGDLSYEWSPDGRFLLVTTGSIVGDMDIALCDASGKKPPVNLSQSGYFNRSPLFLPDGQSVLWSSDRQGMRSPDGKGAQEDIFIAHLTQEAYDAFKLARSGGAGPAEAEAGDRGKKNPDWQPQTEGVLHRITRLTPTSLGGVLYMKAFPDGRELLVLTTNAMGQLLGYRVGLTSESFKQIFAKPMTAAAVSMDDRGETLYALSPAGVERISLADGGSRTIPFEAKLDYDPRGEMAWLFQHFWRLTKLKFYEPTMHGRDWQALRDSYAKFLPGLQQWEDFADLMGEMAGELNASHMGCFWLHQPPLADSTGSLGIYEDYGYTGPGVRVKEVLIGGPCDLAVKPIKPGSIITALDGVPIQHLEHLHAVLNRKAGTPVELSVAADAGAVSRVVVTPVGMEAAKALADDHWTAQRRKATTELSGGRLGYLYLAEMNADNYQRAVDYIFGEGRDKEALVIDVRYNGGGNLHDQLATLFTGDVTADFVSRDGFQASRIPSDRWGKPSILLANASSYSDGSIFPHLYQRLKIGPVVGARVPGTGTAVWWMELLNGSVKYGIPQLGAKDRRTGWFENSETVPDLLIYNSPDDIAGGRDPQLESAVRRMLRDLDAVNKGS